MGNLSWPLASTTRRSRSPGKQTSRSCFFHAMMGLPRSISTSTIWPRPTATSPWRRASARSMGSTRKPLSCCPFWISPGRRFAMSAQIEMQPLQPGDRAPNFVLDAITREGKIAIDDFRGQKPVLVGLFRGLHCAFCRRHIAALAQLDPALREQGVESLTVVNTPIERARLYLRYHPLPLLAAADPERTSHRAFGLPNLEFTENETAWPYKVSMAQASSMQIDLPDELPGPM